MIKDILAGENLYLGDFVKIRNEKAFRASIFELKSNNEKVFMSYNNYGEGEEAVIFDEDTVFRIN